MDEIHPTMRDRIPDPCLDENYLPENCAEFKTVNKALNDGVKLEDLAVYTIDRYQNPSIRCKNCMESIKGVNTLSDKPAKNLHQIKNRKELK